MYIDILGEGFEHCSLHFNVVLGDVEGSLHAYEKAIELQPLQKLFLVNYGRQLKAVKRYEDAENVYRRCVIPF